MKSSCTLSKKPDPAPKTPRPKRKKAKVEAGPSETVGDKVDGIRLEMKKMGETLEGMAKDFEEMTAVMRSWWAREVRREEEKDESVGADLKEVEEHVEANVGLQPEEESGVVAGDRMDDSAESSTLRG